MPRVARVSEGGLLYHVLNRANWRVPLFNTDGDFASFMSILTDAHQRVAMRTLGFCVMPNHWHLLLWPREDGDLSEFMRWLTVTHTQRWHAFHGSAGSGHVYQGRFKSFPVQQCRPSASERAAGVLESGNPAMTVLRYIERNPLRSGLVTSAEQWRWSSLHVRMTGPSEDTPPLTTPTGNLPADWLDIVNCPNTDAELKDLGKSIHRGAPFGNEPWVKRFAANHGLESTLTPRGRPIKPKKGS